MSHVLPKATWSKLLNKVNLAIIWWFWEWVENCLWVLWMFSGREVFKFSLSQWTEKHWKWSQDFWFLGSVPKQMCALRQITEVLGFLPAKLKSLPLPALSVFPALFSTQKEEFYSLLNGEIIRQMSECWRNSLLFLPLLFQKRVYFHQHLYSSLHPLIWSLPSCPENSQEGQILDLVHGETLPQKWETGSAHSYFSQPPSKGVKLYFVFLLLHRQHARSGYGSVSKGRSRNLVPSSALYPVILSLSLQTFR